MENIVPKFVEQGALGILALVLCVILYLFWRADKRAQVYYQRIEETGFDRSQLIKVVNENTKAQTALSSSMGDLVDSQRACREQAMLLHRDVQQFTHNGKD